MKTIWYFLISLVASSFAQLQAQEQPDCTIGYEMKRVLPAHSVTADGLLSAVTITDLVKNFDDGWVKQYHMVSLHTVQGGQNRTATGGSHLLTEEQVSLLHSADTGTKLDVEVVYTPDNTLVNNDVHSVTYSVTVLPSTDAKFDGEGIGDYLAAEGVSSLVTATLDPCDMVAIVFSVDEKGQVEDVELSHSQFYTEDYRQLESELMAAVCAMPAWTPAKFSNGVATSQRQVLLVGNQNSCIINFFNISGEVN